MNSGGVSHFGLNLPTINSSTRSVNRPDMGTSKMLPFMNNGHGASNGGGGGAAGFGPRMYHESPSLASGMSGLGVGGMGGMTSNNMGGYNMAGQNGSLNHMSANKPQGTLIYTEKSRDIYFVFTQ